MLSHTCLKPQRARCVLWVKYCALWVFIVFIYFSLKAHLLHIHFHSFSFILVLSTSGSQPGVIPLPSQEAFGNDIAEYHNGGGGEGALGASSGQRPGMLLNTPKDTGQPSTAKNPPAPKISVAKNETPSSLPCLSPVATWSFCLYVFI